MSYLVLARKYRPRSFEAMVGQEHVVQALANALTQQRLHHAYLFTGTRGVGKTTVSRILAKSLNCTGADGLGSITARPCGVCDACRDIDSGRFVDYVELDAASNRGVEEITQLLDQAVYKPVLGRFKVYMIDEVHMLSNHAFNAMLKTLEEPPEYLKFVLATTDPQKVPPTVLSRCLQFNLRPMALATLQSHLDQVLAEEGIAAEPGALRLLARAARGSMRDALSLADQAIAFGAGHLGEAGIRQMLGAVDRGHAVRLLDALASSDGPALLASADGLRGLGLSAAGTLEEMAELLQRMAVLQAVPSAAQGDEAEQADALRLSTLFGADETALLYSMCLHGRAELGLAPDEYGGLVMVLLRMLAFRPGDLREATAAPIAAAPRPAVPLQAPQVAKAVIPLAVQTVPRRWPSPAENGSMASRTVTSSPVSKSVVAHVNTTPVAKPRKDDLPPWLDAPDAEAEPDDPPACESELGVAAQPSSPVPAERRMTSARDERVTRASDPVGEGKPLASSLGPRLQPTPLGARWSAAVNALLAQGSISALVREMAWQAQCVAITEAAAPGEQSVWRLRVDREVLRAPAHAERLQAALSGWLQAPVRIETEAGATTDTPALRASAERERLQQAAEAAISQDPLVLQLLAQYKTARIVPGSIQPC